MALSSNNPHHNPNVILLVLTGRVSSIGDISIIPNISAICNYQVNETAAITRCNMTTFNETQATKTENIESSLQAIDLTRPPSDMFLDGCKVG